jgi:hypothetical protein
MVGSTSWNPPDFLIKTMSKRTVTVSYYFPTMSFAESNAWLAARGQLGRKLTHLPEANEPQAAANQAVATHVTPDDLKKISSDLRASLDEVVLAASGKEASALHALHKELGLFQRRIHAVLHPVLPLNETQEDTVKRQWAEFTRDTQVIEFCERKKLLPSKGRMWFWVTEQREGEIIGLPTCRGTPRITNGVEVWIEKSDGSLFLGHQDWFQGDSRMGVEAPRRKKSVKTLLKEAMAESNTVINETGHEGEALRAKILAMLAAK